MAEGVGVEPTHGFNPVYGLAIRCITVLPALRRFLVLTKVFPSVNLKKQTKSILSTMQQSIR